MAGNENNRDADVENRLTSLENNFSTFEHRFDIFVQEMKDFKEEMRANVVRQDADMRELRANVNGTTHNMFIAVVVAVGGMLLSVWLK